MGSLRAYNCLKGVVEDAVESWGKYNDPQRVYCALQTIDLLARINDPTLYIAAMELVGTAPELQTLVEKYR